MNVKMKLSKLLLALRCYIMLKSLIRKFDLSLTLNPVNAKFYATYICAIIKSLAQDMIKQFFELVLKFLQLEKIDIFVDANSESPSW